MTLTKIRAATTAPRAVTGIVAHLACRKQIKILVHD
jgi:hypothetical protein